MAAGEYVSMKAQRELLERELAVERRELARHPHAETVELAHIYMARGVAPDTAREVAAELMKDPETALEAHARDELGIDPGSLGSPWGAAGSSFLAFCLGAFIPLVPWLFGSGDSRQARLGGPWRPSRRRSSAGCSPGSRADRSCSRPSRQVLDRRPSLRASPTASACCSAPDWLRERGRARTRAARGAA